MEVKTGNLVEQRTSQVIPSTLPRKTLPLPVARQLNRLGNGLLSSPMRQRLNRRMAVYRPLLANLDPLEANVAALVARDAVTVDLVSGAVLDILIAADPESKMWRLCLDCWVRLEEIKASRRAELVTWIEKAKAGDRSPLSLVRSEG